MSAPRVLPSLLLAFLLGVSALAVHPAAAYPVTAAQAGTVAATFGDGAPFQAWQIRTQSVRLFLDSDPTGDENTPVSLGTPPGAALKLPVPTAKIENPGAHPFINPSQADAIASPDADDRQVLIGAPTNSVPQVGDPGVAIRARFPLAAEALPTDNVTLYEVGASIRAACDSRALAFAFGSSPGASASTGGIRAHIDLEHTSDGGATWTQTRRLTRRDTTDLLMLKPVTALPAVSQPPEPGIINTWTAANIVLGSPTLGGVALHRGVDRLMITFELAGAGTDLPPSGECVIHYGTSNYPSAVIAKDDSARVATVLEDADGNHATGYPAAGSADAAHRKVVVHSLEATPWGNGGSQQMGFETNIRVRDTASDEYVYYVEDFDDSPPLERDVRAMDLVAREDKLLSPTVVDRVFTLSYPPTFENARLQVETYAEDQKWDIQGTVFQVGGRGIDLSVPTGETLEHTVLRGEPTSFAFLVKNTGTQDDVITVAATDPAGGWTAAVSNGGRYFVRAGGSQVGTVEITPGAGASSAPTVTLTASSSFGDVANPPSITYKATVTDTLTRKLDVLSDTSSLVVRPGVTKSFAVTVRNLGTARDSVLVLASFPANVQGWSIRANPSSLQLVAGGFAQVQLTMTPPASAPSGLAFPLGLTVSEVGDSSVSDRLDMTVTVLQREGLLASVVDGSNRTMRLIGPECSGDPNPVVPCAASSAEVCPGPPVPPCVNRSGVGTEFPDTDYDNKALFDIPIQNAGDQPDRYTVTAWWDLDEPGTQDNTGCEYSFFNDPGDGRTDGIPDGWRFNYPADDSQLDPVDDNPPRGSLTYNHFSGYYGLNDTEHPFVVPAGATRALYIELGWLDDDPCPLNDDTPAGEGGEIQGDSLASAAAMRVRIQSLNEPTRVAEVRLVGKVEDAGSLQGLDDYSSAVHSVAIGPDGTFPPVMPVLRTGSGSFDLVASNRGNEFDRLRIAVSGSPSWSHRITVTSTKVGTVECDPPTNNGALVSCPNVGVYDEIHFRVTTTPGTDVSIGDRDAMTVTVFSGDAPGVFATQALTARAAGTLAFAARVLGDSTRTVAAGKSVAFPVEVSNQGTADDSYRVTVITPSESSWRPLVSTSAPLFVPAGYSVPAFVTVTPPATAPAGTQAQFTVQVESVSSPSRQTLSLVGVSTAPGALTLAGADGQDVLVPARGVAQDVTVVATKLSGAAGDRVTFHVDRDSLPAGWQVDDGEADLDRDIVRNMTVSSGSALPRASATFKVTAPPEALGTARAILHVDAATNTTLKAATDLALDLASTKGVLLSLDGNKTQVVAPGGPATYNLTVKNLGLGQDSFTLSNSQLPPGWSLVLNPPTATLGPLQSLDALAKLTAPTSAKPGDQANVVLFAVSASDAGQVSSQVLHAQVGYNALAIEAPGDDAYGAPQETLTRVLNVTNTGTLPDQVQLRPSVDTTGLRGSVNQTASPAMFTLLPGETRQVTYSLRLGDSVPSEAIVQSTVKAVSLIDARPEASRANASQPLRFHVLPYRALDVNGDQVLEYAVDRDRDASDGFEQFKPNTMPGGRPLSLPDLARFLRDDARASFERDVTLANGTTQRVLVYTLDGDGDGQRDLFLDQDGDDQPDFYWDPDAGKASRIEFRKDVNGDQAPESFVDTDGDGRLDSAFDLTRGAFTKVLQVDVDGDGKLDYVVDRDGDGQVDQDETVLYTRTGGLLIVQKVDVDGDKRLDQVYDTDGDGNPDYFIPAGSTESVPITMRDVNGDGVMDWTFDGDNDGRKESYYDPATGSSHTIDAAGHFADALRQYWYIGALFGVVLVLFVALALVTRR
jgi:uncharacterized membrane protein